MHFVVVLVMFSEMLYSQNVLSNFYLLKGFSFSPFLLANIHEENSRKAPVKLEVLPAKILACWKQFSLYTTTRLYTGRLGAYYNTNSCFTFRPLLSSSFCPTEKMNSESLH